MKKERIVYLLIIAVLIAVILLMRSCKSNPCPEIVASHSTIDTIKGKSDSAYKPISLPVRVDGYVPKPLDSVKKLSFPAIKNPQKLPAVNSEELIDKSADPGRDYTLIPDYPINYYADTLWFKRNGELVGYALVKDTVEASEITGRSYEYAIYNKTITNNLVTAPRNKYFAGFEAIGNQFTPLQYFGVTIALQGKKKKRIYNVGVGVMNQKLFYKAGILFPIN